MKILIISGFLGAGKTTFIQELIRRTGEQFAVLENEYGQTDVDTQILSSQDSSNVWDLTEGCVCCTKSNDMIGSVMTIENVVSPEYLIVEPSGIGKLSNVLRTLQKIEYDRITLLKPITIIDGNSFLHDRLEFKDIYEDQIASSGTVMVSKPDHPDPDLLLEIEEFVRKLNPEADFLATHYTGQDREWFRDLLRQAYSGGPIAISTDEAPDLETLPLHDCREISPAEMMVVLQRALFGRYGEVVRAKGILPYPGGWMRFDIAGGQASVTGLDGLEEDLGADPGDRKASCVWIGRGLDRFALMQILSPEALTLRRGTSSPSKTQKESASGSDRDGLRSGLFNR